MSDMFGPSDGAGADVPKPVAVIDGACGRKPNNALTMRFLHNGTGEPFATALQSGEAVDFVAGGFVSEAGGSLPLPFLGTRIVLF